MKNFEKVRRASKWIMLATLCFFILAEDTVQVSAEILPEDCLNYIPCEIERIKPSKMKVVDIRTTKKFYLHSCERVRFSAGGKATWKSGNESIVKIDSNGIATTTDIGRKQVSYNFKITAKRNGKTYKCSITVFPLFLDTTGYSFDRINETENIQISRNRMDFPDDGITPVLYPGEVLEKITVSAKSSDPSVIKIRTPKGSGWGIVFEPQKEGTATITVKVKTQAGYTHVLKQKMIVTKEYKSDYLERLAQNWAKDAHKNLTEQEAMSRLTRFSEKSFEEGSRWHASSRYYGTKGSQAFALKLSNYIFGNEYVEKYPYKAVKVRKGIPFTISDTYISISHNLYANPASYVYYPEELRCGDVVLLEDSDNPGEISRCAVFMYKEAAGEDEYSYHLAEGDVDGKVTYQTVLSESEMQELFYRGLTRY